MSFVIVDVFFSKNRSEKKEKKHGKNPKKNGFFPTL